MHAIQDLGTILERLSTSLQFSTLVIPCAIISLALYYLFNHVLKSNRRGPPGPRNRLDIVSWISAFFSNMRFMTIDRGADMTTWMRFTALHKIYGPIVSLYQGSTFVVVIGTIKAATDLLEKRGNIYSSRPRNIMAGEILSGGMRGLGMQYGPRWRNWRALMHARMGVEASNEYKVLQGIESAIMLRDILQDRMCSGPEYRSQTASTHFKRFATSIAFCIGYGRRIKSLDDPIVVANTKTDETYSRYSTPGKYIVESWPILLKLPKPLQWFRYAAERQKKLDTELYMSLMNGVKSQMELGIAHASTARRALEKQKETGLTDLETAYALSSPFTAGINTTMASFQFFILAMLHYPEEMKKAQAHIDQVVGSDRLPNFEDAEALPYIHAMIKENMRWRPIAPLAIPHSNIADDVYNDMLIPSGTTIFANLYAMSKDEEMFPSANEFKPERYMHSSTERSGADTFFFGFGRRICPGMHIAHNSLFIMITRLLWAFDILPPLDRAGNPALPPIDKFTEGIVTYPQPFEYRMEPRKDKEGGADMISQVIGEFGIKAEEDAQGWM